MAAFTPVPNWTPPPRPDGAPLEGRYARLERLGAAHVPDLFAANAASEAIWTFLPYGPFGSEAAYGDWVASVADGADPFFYAVINRATGRAEGVLSYLRIAPGAGSIEVGHINFSPRLQKTRAGTEAVYLTIRWAFQAGYRRFEWKCDALNRGSRAAAERYGLSYEGVFRQAAVVKGRNRDTAWFAAIDCEWPALERAFGTWLDGGNFDAGGRQKQSLASLTRPILVTRDPAAAA